MYLCIYVSMHVRMYVRMYVCACVCVYVCTYVCVYAAAKNETVGNYDVHVIVQGRMHVYAAACAMCASRCAHQRGQQEPDGKTVGA